MLLELDHLCAQYGRHRALDDLTLNLESKALGLLGPNGAGKSTLIRLLIGLVPAHGGTARLEGLDVRREQRRVRELIGYMPEHESYLAGMTVVRFLRFMGEMCGLEPGAAMERAHEVLFYVGLGEVRYRKVETLSYGLQQKVRLAQALIHGPKILILDEPTNGLDPEARRDMLGLIRDMIEHSASKVIMSSHLLRDIEECCQEVLVLKRGHIVAAGNIEAMKHTDERLLELRVKGEIDPFVAELGALGCECRLGQHDGLQVSLPAGLAPREIFAVASRRSVQLRHFYAKKDSLEDIFIKVMEDEAPPGAPSRNGKQRPAQ